MGDLGEFCSDSLKIIKLLFPLKEVVLPAIGAGLTSFGLTCYFGRKDIKFERDILYGFMGEFPEDKVLRINYPSGETDYLDSNYINEAIRKNKHNQLSFA